MRTFKDAWFKVGLLAALSMVTVALGDITVPQPGTAITAFSFTCVSTKQCPASVPINSAGTEEFTATNPGYANSIGTYQAVAASQTATVLQTSTGATGDYLSFCTIFPTSTSPGVVTVFDNTNTAANSAILFPGGASSTSNLVPFSIPVGSKSVNGAWKVTTGSAVSVVCYGKFS